MAPALTVPEKKNGEGAKTTTLAPAGPLATLIKYTQDPDTKKRLSEMLGNRAGAFSNSIINVVKNSRQLQNIATKNPASIMSAAMIAASVNLPIDPALGFAAIVPYGGKEPAAQFQLMYKGLIQLAQRTGKYKTMNEAVVYVDELESYNPITGELKFTPQAGWKVRYAPEQRLEDVAGFYFRFELMSGFEMARFISMKEAMAHGQIGRAHV
jgi:recombination protein RecT